jgi:hypothetical protein
MVLRPLLTSESPNFLFLVCCCFCVTLFCFCFFGTGSLYVAQAGLPQPSEFCYYNAHPHTWFQIFYALGAPVCSWSTFLLCLWTTRLYPVFMSFQLALNLPFLPQTSDLLLQLHYSLSQFLTITLKRFCISDWALTLVLVRILSLLMIFVSVLAVPWVVGVQIQPITGKFHRASSMHKPLVWGPCTLIVQRFFALWPSCLVNS